MKKIALLTLSLMTLPVYAQSVWDTLGNHQNSLPGDSSSDSTRKSLPVTTTPIESASATPQACSPSEPQKSIPLKALTKLILQNPADLSVQHDARRGTITLRSPRMIGNCSSMIEWKKKELDLDGKKTYALEAQLKNGSNCVDGKCSYTIPKMENGEHVGSEEIQFAPTMLGFQQCLERSIFKDGAIDPKKIYNSPVSEVFTDVRETGDILFVSHGNAANQLQQRYGSDFSSIQGCDFYEPIIPSGAVARSESDAESARIAAMEAELSTCTDAQTVLNSEAFPSSPMLQRLLHDLLLKDAETAAKSMSEGKPVTEDQMKTMENFGIYVVQPQIQKVQDLYAQVAALEGSAKASKQRELTVELNKLRALNRAPYFEQKHIDKLFADGKFEDAEKMSNLKITMEANGRLGTRDGNVVFTPEVVESRIVRARREFATRVEKETSNYAIRTGEDTSQSRIAREKAARHRQFITRRTQSHTQRAMEIQQEIQSGYCSAYFRNYATCMQERQEELRDLQTRMTHNNQIDTELAEKYDREAAEYAQMEAEGRRYIAAQNGEEVSAEAPAEVDTTLPPERNTNAPGTYGFNIPAQPGQPQQIAPQWGQSPQMMGGYTGQIYAGANMPQQNPYNPMYSQQQYGQNFLGGQAMYGQMGMSGMPGGFMGMGTGQNQTYGFNMGGAGYPQQQGMYGQMPQQGMYPQQPQMGYYGQPYTAQAQYGLFLGR